MDVSELIANIFQVCIIPLLGLLTTYFIKWVKVKSAEIQTNIDSETLQKYVNMLADTITECVIATNQTYVDSLKEQGKFDAEAQKIAFNQTLNAVLNILSEEAKEYLTAAFGDLNEYLITKIEAEVNKNKITAVAA